MGKNRGLEVALGMLLTLSVGACGAPRKRQETISVRRVWVSASTQGNSGAQVQAGPDRVFVNLDCHASLHIKNVDLDDFQLIKEKTAVGREENVGSNTEDDAFFWYPIDESGNPVPSIASDAANFSVRLTLKVPRESRSGYLACRGQYWGPLAWEPASP